MEVLLKVVSVTFRVVQLDSAANRSGMSGTEER